MTESLAALDGARNRQVIGVTAYASRARWGVWDAQALLVPRSYAEAVVDGGAVPVILPPVPDVIAAVLPRLDGLILSGGPDVDPARYGHEPGAHTQPPDLDRDAAELRLLAGAVDAGLPTLGICRGMQLLNVARGGTLHQHLPDVVGSSVHAPAPGVYSAHPVTVDEGTRLAQILGRTRVEVPTYHHQGVQDLGKGLVATAWAADGTVEAVEDPELPFLVAVQWHPEAGDDPALFRALARATADRR